MKELDQNLTARVTTLETPNKKLTSILDRATQGLKLKDSELLYLLELESEDECRMLYKAANLLRQKHLGKSCCIHAIIEFSNT